MTSVPVYIRYLDHVLFKDVDPAAFSAPFIRETIGWLEKENDNAIQIVWERFAKAPMQPPNNIHDREEVRQKATGLTVMKSAIIELRRLEK